MEQETFPLEPIKNVTDGKKHVNQEDIFLASDFVTTGWLPDVFYVTCDIIPLEFRA